MGAGLIIGFFASIVGMGYFAYGKRAAKFVPMIAGALLCVFPYFTSSTLWLCTIGGALLAAPFLLDF